MTSICFDDRRVRPNDRAERFRLLDEGCSHARQLPTDAHYCETEDHADHHIPAFGEGLVFWHDDELGFERARREDEEDATAEFVSQFEISASVHGFTKYDCNRWWNLKLEEKRALRPKRKPCRPSHKRERAKRLLRTLKPARYLNAGRHDRRTRVVTARMEIKALKFDFASVESVRLSVRKCLIRHKRKAPAEMSRVAA